MDIFEKLKCGDAVDMMSEEYRPVIEELHRADTALFHVNHAEPRSSAQRAALEELFDGAYPSGLGLFTPIQIDFPKQMTFGNHDWIILSNYETLDCYTYIGTLEVTRLAGSRGDTSS